MLRIAVILTFIGFVSACSSVSLFERRNAPSLPEVAPVESTPVEETFTNGMAHVTLKAFSQSQASGLIHLIQGKEKINAEVMVEGLRAGPYQISVGDSAKCTDLKLVNEKKLGHFVADSKGKIKANFEISKMNVRELLQKKFVLYSQVRKKKEFAACGVSELVANHDVH